MFSSYICLGNTALVLGPNHISLKQWSHPVSLLLLSTSLLQGPALPALLKAWGIFYGPSLTSVIFRSGTCSDQMFILFNKLTQTTGVWIIQECAPFIWRTLFEAPDIKCEKAKNSFMGSPKTMKEQELVDSLRLPTGWWIWWTGLQCKTGN